MRYVVDANILVCVNGFGIWNQVLTFLQQCDVVLVTIASVYGKELPDSLRTTANQMIEAGALELAADPDKRNQPAKHIKKLRKKITRHARSCPPTSAVDQQLLLVAIDRDIPLVTDENPLRQLADSCNASPIYDLLDVIEGLFAGAALNATKRQEILAANPGGRETSTEELRQELNDRGGPQRFGCQN